MYNTCKLIIQFSGTKIETFIVTLYSSIPNMCIECIGRICCGNVNLNQNEIQLTSGYNIISQKFLAKRKTTLGFLSICALIGVMYNIYLLTNIINDLETLSDKYDNNTVNILIEIYKGLLGYLFAYDIIILGFIVAMYYFWSNYKLGSKLSLTLWIIINTMPIILLYVPIKTIIYNYIDGWFTPFIAIIIIALIFYVAISMLIPVLIVVQTFLLRINSLFREFEKTYEYRIISTVLIMIYVPIYLVIVSVLFQVTNDYLIYGFIITYTIFLIIPIVTRNDYIVYTSWAFGISAIVFLGVLMNMYFNVNIYSSFISGYIRSLLIDLLVTDFINTTIMNNKSAEADSKFNVLMRDFGYCNEEKTQLTTVEISNM
jgi:hypothetical protein